MRPRRGHLRGGACVFVEEDPANCGGCGTVCGSDEVCSDGACSVGCAEGLTSCDGGMRRPVRQRRSLRRLRHRLRRWRGLHRRGLRLPRWRAALRRGVCRRRVRPGQLRGVRQRLLGRRALLGRYVRVRMRAGADGLRWPLHRYPHRLGQLRRLRHPLRSRAGVRGGNLYGRSDVRAEGRRCAARPASTWPRARGTAGRCGERCPTGSTCSLGRCVTRCDFTDCSGSCVNTSSSVLHCGGCDMRCRLDEVCTSGRCVSRTICPRGTVACGNSCVDTQTDEANCGSCGTRCGSLETCVQRSLLHPALLTSGAESSDSAASEAGLVASAGGHWRSCRSARAASASRPSSRRTSTRRCRDAGSPARSSCAARS